VELTRPLSPSLVCGPGSRLFAATAALLTILGVADALAINQNTVVSDVQVENQTLDLNIPDSKTTSHTVVLRADVWLLTVLNVYGLFGYTNGQMFRF